DRDSGTKILIVPGPQRRFAVHLAARAVADGFVEGLANGHGALAIRDELVQAGIRRDLISTGFIDGLKQGIAKPSCDRQRWPDVPGVLYIEIVVPGPKILRYLRVLWDLHVPRRAVVLPGHLGNQSDQINDGVVIWVSVVQIDARETKCTRIETSATACRPGTQPVWVRGCIVDVGNIASAGICDQPDVGSKL